MLHQLDDNTITPGEPDDVITIGISNERLSTLLLCFKQQQETIAVMTQSINGQQSRNQAGITANLSQQVQQSSNYTKNPEYYNNAKYEDIISKPLKPSYDGLPELLIPFINWLDIF